jgi:hypothetical protein
VRKPAKGSPKRESVANCEIIAQSNGHKWIEWHGMVCCRDCGFIRRADDKNKPCHGIVRVTLRT